MRSFHFSPAVFLIAILKGCLYNQTMHELSVTESILGIVIKHAKKNHVGKVVTIHLKIGELTDLVDEYIQHYFDYLSKGTIAEGAVLNMERSPVVFQCTDCKMQFHVSLKDSGKIVCSQCGGAKVSLVSGREFYIKHIEVI
jgi:hydrogenase nickel incorporation protein HypA/HybF